MEPIRVLQEDVILGPGGIESFLMNVYRHIDRDQLQFDFMVHRPQEAVHEKEVRELGGKIYRTPGVNPLNPSDYNKSVMEVLNAHPEYKVIHAHADLNGWALRCAAKCGVPTRIAHCHSAKSVINAKYFLIRYEKLWIKKYCTDMFMCSTPAGEWLFGKKAVADGKVKFIKNGVESQRFQYDEKARAEIREEIGAGDKLVFCHVGNFTQPKNNKFLVDVFAEIHKMNPNTMLIMAGDGALREECMQKVASLGLNDSVKYLGVRKDIPRVLQGADLFVFPSLWEGLPLSCVEAQSTGLPVLMSDSITPEVLITDGAKTCSLASGAEHWAKEALKLCTSYKRRDCRNDIIKAGFDIQDTADFLQEFYLERTLKAMHAQKNN